MTARKRASDADRSGIVARHMADALTYLSNVALGAGFRSISEDLLSVRQRLNDEHVSPDQVRRAPARPRQRVRDAHAPSQIKRKR